MRWLQKELDVESTRRNALLMGAQIRLSKEEYANGTGQRSNNAVVRDAQIKLSREEFANGMGQRSNDAVLRDAQIKSFKEECALDMVQRSRPSDATLKDVQNTLCFAATIQITYC